MTAATARADEPGPPDDETAPDPEGAPPWHHPRRRPLLAVDGGYAVQSLYGIPITGMGFGALLGVTQGDLSLGAAFEFDRGWTEAGLQTTTVDIGGYVEHRIDRLALGGCVRVGTFDVSRVTNTSPLLSTSAGVFLRASYDLVTFGRDDRSALYLLGRASVDTVDAPLYAAGVSLGVRL
jgi:hypothetical protein